MDDRRKHSRLKFEIECHLKGSAGDIYKVLLDDLSFSGALVKVGEIAQFRSGDLCELVVCGTIEDACIKHYSKVVWVDSEGIGLNFLN